MSLYSLPKGGASAGDPCFSGDNERGGVSDSLARDRPRPNLLYNSILCLSLRAKYAVVTIANAMPSTGGYTFAIVLIGLYIGETQKDHKFDRGCVTD